MLSDLLTPDVRFAGVGASGDAANDVARALADRLNHWSAEHPRCRILKLTVQSTARGATIEMSAIVAYVEEADIVRAALESAEEQEAGKTAEVVLIAEEIVADALDD